jgi:hypothetical protein
VAQVRLLVTVFHFASIGTGEEKKFKMKGEHIDVQCAFNVMRQAPASGKV